MMKYFVLPFIALLFINCNPRTQQKPLEVEKVISTDGDSILLGEINQANLKTSSLTTWYNEGYGIMEVSPEWVAEVKPLTEGVSIKIFMGTWCSDSQREVPKFFKLLDALEFDQEQVQMYTMSREKTTPQNFEEGLDIINVPTMIFYKNGKEMNRFVEFAIEDLATDIRKILQEEDYKHPYF